MADDEVIELEDLLAHLRTVVAERPVAFAVFLVVIGACVALALVPHTMGAVGGDVDDAFLNADTNPDSFGAQQQFQNEQVVHVQLEGSLVLLLVAVVATFVGTRYGTRTDRSHPVVLGLVTGVAVAVGFELVVELIRPAIGDARPNTYTGQETSDLVYDAVAVKSVSLGVFAAVWSTLAAAFGRTVDGTDSDTLRSALDDALRGVPADGEDDADGRALVGPGTEACGLPVVALCVVVVVLGSGLALALVPHVLGAVGPDLMHSGFEGWFPEPVEDPKQAYRNYLTALVVIPAAAPAGVLFSVVVAFAAAVHASGSRRARTATVSVAAALGLGLGYALLVLVSQAAYGPTANGFLLQEYPVTRDYAAIATNALSLAVAAGVGSAFAGVAGTTVAPPERSDSLDGASTDEDGVAAGEEATPEGVDGSDVRDDGPENTSGAGDAVSGRPPTDASAPASDHGATEPPSNAETPRYDPEDRDWDGGDGD